MMLWQIFGEEHSCNDSQDAQNCHYYQQFHQGYAALFSTISVQIGLVLFEEL